MCGPTIRLYFRRSDGAIEDGQIEYETSAFAGFVPSVGDEVVDPGVLQGQDRRDYRNRQILTVVRRVFSPKDKEGSIALVVEPRPASDQDRDIV